MKMNVILARVIAIMLWMPCLALSQGEMGDSLWTPFSFFEGTWQGEVTGKSGIGDGECVYESIMNGTYFVCKNRAVFRPPSDEVHEDWTIFSYDKRRKTYVIRQFNSEGYINQFVLDSLSADNRYFSFISESTENSPSGLRARLSFELKSIDVFEESFELAPPGKDFSICIRNIWKRRNRGVTEK